MEAKVLMDRPQGPRITVGITIGDGLSFAVQECPKRAPRLVITERSDFTPVVTLGVLTNKRLDDLIDYLNRLRCHAL